MTAPITPATRLLAAATLHSPACFTAAALASVVGGASSLAIPRLLADLLDGLLAHRSQSGRLAVLALVLAVSASAAALGTLAGTAGGAAAVGWLRRGVVRRVLDAGLAGQRRYSAPDATGRLVGSCEEAGYAGIAVLDTLVSVATAAAGVVALWLIDWRPAAAFLLGVPLVHLTVRLFFRRTSAAFSRYQEIQADIAARLVDALAGVRSIRAGGTEAVERDRVLAPLAALSRAGAQIWHLQRSTAWQLGLLLPAIEILVLAVTGHGVIVGRISPGQLLAAGGYTALALGLFRQVDAILGLAGAAAAARRTAEVLGQPVPTRGERVLSGSPVGCAVVLRGVTTSIEGRTVLDRIDLSVPAGTSLAVVGRSGHGKSNLAALIGRLHDPDTGEVLLDGVPVGELGDEQLARCVAYAFERPALLGRTIRGTIGLGRPGAGEAVIERAARAARAHEFVRRLPDGYDTEPARAPLSGGETQRLGLARAFAQDARVVVLDDATSSLDTATEAEVGEALATAFADRTRIVVAHRASTAAGADRVAWLVDGRIRAVAPHARLWQDQDYRALFGVRTEDPCPQLP
ncbi:ABC transporter ATP-binding protein [Kitasatospora sp. NPDC049258]|uniref:ABC transporter ATP-binding protein n=1 Tax=Kitasatospora sp. NPDC049258 TaxID=3155394 RepID=UPI00342D9A9F